jgi:hypothetical protein
MIPSAVELSVVSSVDSCGWSISERDVQVKVPYFALTKTAPNSASATEETTCCENYGMAKEWVICEECGF